MYRPSTEDIIANSFENSIKSNNDESAGPLSKLQTMTSSSQRQDLVWSRCDEDEQDDVNRWTDHTTVTAFEETITKLERAVETLETLARDPAQANMEEVSVSIPSSTSPKLLLNLRRLRNSHALVDFTRNDARSSLTSRWFGVQSPYYLLTEGSSLHADRSSAQKLLGSLSVALCNTKTKIPGFVAYHATPTHAPVYLGCSSSSYFESDVEASGWSTSKLEDFQRMFRAAYSSDVSKKISVRLTWQLKRLPGTAAREDGGALLLGGIRVSAVFPLAPEGAYFDNQLFSTIIPEKAPLWTVLAVWSCARPTTSGGGGSGSYEDESGGSSIIASPVNTMTPMSQGLARLVGLRKSLSSRKEQEKSSRKEFIQSLARRLRQSRLKIREIADTLARDAFDSKTSPLTRLVLSLVQWLGSLDGSAQSFSRMVDDEADIMNKPSPIVEESQLIVEAVWMSFCAQLRQRFESKDESLFNVGDEATKVLLEPDLARGLAHQKVTLIRFCTRELSMCKQDGDASHMMHKQEQAPEETVDEQAEEDALKSTLLDSNTADATKGGEESKVHDPKDHQSLEKGVVEEGGHDEDKVAQKNPPSRRGQKRAKEQEGTMSRAEPLTVEMDAPPGRSHELAYFLTKFPGTRRAFAPLCQASSVWSHREDDGIEMDRSLRAELASPSLISDMRAFKAANPGCEFVDFLKWFSPKDVTSESEPSERMSNGLWMETWQNTTPALEATKQKKLFDPIVVAEKSLHWLEVLGLDALCENLVDEAVTGMKEVARQSPSGIVGGGDMSVAQEAQDATSLLRFFPVVEARLSRIEALRESIGILPEQLVNELVSKDGSAEVRKDDKEVVEFLLGRIRAERGGVNQPDKKEYLLLGAATSQQERMYASTSHGELRVARVVPMDA